MYASPLRCCKAIKNNTGVLAIHNGNLGQIVSIISQRNYAKDKGKDCCTPINQTAGKKVSEWPSPSDHPPTAWRAECPSYPQPPNYDPYKIKVPDIVVPPLPVSNAKWTGVVLSAFEPPGGQGQDYRGMQNQGFPQQQQGEEKEEQTESFFGMLKRLWGGPQEDEKPKGSGQMIVPPNFKELPNEDAVDNPMALNQCQMPLGPCKDLFQNSHIIHPDYWTNKPEKRLQELAKQTLPKLGYHGQTKYKYAFHEPWKPLDRLALLEQAEKEESPVPDDEVVSDKTQ